MHRDVALALDGKSGHRLSRLRDSVHDLLRPARLDANHDRRGHIGIRAGADHGAEEKLEVLAELQAPVGVGQAQRALDVVGHGLGRGI